MAISFRSRLRLPLLAIAALAVSALVLLLAPGFSTQVPPAETIGGDLVVSGADFGSRGEFLNTALTNAGPETAAVSLSGDSSRGSFTSTVQEADIEFSALGLHWLADTPGGSTLAASVRFSSDGDSWGEWIPIQVEEDVGPDNIDETRSAGESIGQLAFADHGRYFQYRFDFQGGSSGATPSLSRLTASFIDAKGYHESPLSPAAVGRLAGTVFAGPQTAAAAPRIISRAEWGADESYMQWDPEYVMPKKQIIHHTVTSNYDPDPAATVRSIYYYHAVSLGWGDIGYNYLIDRDGNIYEGRFGGNAVVGGHALEWNYGSIGIAVLGDYSSSYSTAATNAALISLMQWKSNANRIDPYGFDYMLGTNLPNYLGHRDVGTTACPGNGLHELLPTLRASVAYSPEPVDEPIYTKWDALHGAPGGATNQQYPVSGGLAQDFSMGRIIWDNSAGQGYWVLGGILGKYDSLGAYDGFLGMPRSDEYGIASGRANDFVGGNIYWSATSNAQVVYGAILSKYLDEGGPGRIGFPVTDEYDAPGVSGGRESDFQSGRIYWTPGYGTYMVYGGILAKYLETGGSSVWGPPTDDEYDISGVSGGRQSDFAGGHILWGPSTGAHVSLGAIYDKYLEWDGPAGYFGMPTSDEYAGYTGRAQDYQQGVITYYQSAGTHVVYGAIYNKYLELGGPESAVGPALTDEIDVTGVAGARANEFLNGRIYWSPETGTHAVYGGILHTYLAKGGPASLGLPVTDEYAISGLADGRQSDFQFAKIYYHPATGAHEVYGAIYAKWMQFGGPTGGLGMPTTGEYDAGGGGRGSDFQGGNIYWSAATDVHAVYGGILAKYLELGGPGGSLGLPVTDEYAYGGGRRSDFQNGYIFWSPATGVQAFVGGSTTVTADSAFEVRDGNGALLGTLGAGQEVAVTYSGGNYTVQGPGLSHSGAAYIRMSPTVGSGIMQVTSYHDVPSWNPGIDDNRFRGAIEVRYSAVSNKLWVINELPLELYLRGIAETSSGLPTEFLRAMSVAGRDYALYHVNRGGKYYGNGQDIFHLKNSRNGNGDDQVYKGYGLEARFPDLVSAVDSTTGQVVTYQGDIAIATYFSNSDGRTRSAQEAWGSDYWPWLQSVPDPDCNGMSLNGHGVGMSGYGALKRAERGDSYQAILTYYYSGTAVQAMDTNKNIRVAITSL